MLSKIIPSVHEIEEALGRQLTPTERRRIELAQRVIENPDGAKFEGGAEGE